ncbi:hypothetical protein [Streptomyces sp. MI02-7b]|uniref:hypothetical protein n=1 Tax=Streptomyces sp. MI02-7b TaxID=462941 RepID=UPI0029CA9B26|nr:hypothetical protein [Streptomyces sp. MI02-7b]
MPATAGRGLWRRLPARFTDLCAIVLLIASSRSWHTDCRAPTTVGRSNSPWPS